MITLDDQDKIVQHINSVIKQKGLKLKAYLSKEDDYREYVLFNNKGAVYASQQLEAIFVRLDVIKANEDYYRRQT